MKPTYKFVWLLTIMLVGFGVFILSIPYRNVGLNTIVATEGKLDIADYNFSSGGPAQITGEFAYFKDKILYDDELLEDEMENVQFVRVDKHLPIKTFGAHGYGTYVFEMNPPKASQIVAMEIPVISSAYKLWVNGKLLASNGRVDPRVEVFLPHMTPQRVILPPFDENTRVVIQVANYHFSYIGIGKPLIIGSPEQIMQRQVNSHLQEYMIIAISILTGAYHIAVYSIRKEEKSTLHFGLFAIFLAITLTFFGERAIHSVFPKLDWYAMGQTGYFLASVTILLMLRYVILLDVKRQDTPFERLLQVMLLIAFTARAVMVSKPNYIWFIHTYIAIGIVIFIYSMAMLAFHMRNGSRGLKMTVAGIYLSLLVFFSNLFDMFNEQFSNFGLLLFIFFHALVLGLRYSETFSLNLDLADALKRSALKLQSKNFELVQTKESLEELNVQLDSKVNERTEDIKLLLDHSGQAFLSLDSASRIQVGYSNLSQVYLGEDLAGQLFWEVIGEAQSETVSMLCLAVERALGEKSALRRESYLSVLPESIRVKDRELKIEYKPIQTPFKVQVMVIMTDVSYEKSLMNQIEVEARENWTNMKIVLYAQEFWRIYNRIELFCNLESEYFIEGQTDVQALEESVMKSLHNFKGQLSMYGFSEVIAYVHEMEQDIMDQAWKTTAVLKEYIHQCKLIEVLDTRLKKIYENEGIDIYEYRDTVRLSRTKIDEVVTVLEETLGEDAQALVRNLYTEKHHPFRKIFEGYIDYVVLLGRSIGKEINPLQINGGKFLVDLSEYTGFSKALVHVLRNMVDHGIEKPELRYERGKPRAGTIRVNIEKVADSIVIKMTDDGAGVDFEKLKMSVAEAINMSLEEVNAMDRPTLLRHVFSPEVSVKQESDIVSGRGLGMALVFEAVAQLGGSIEISSVLHEELCLIFTLPYHL